MRLYRGGSCCQSLGRAKPYHSEGLSPRLARRDLEIYYEFNGANHARLAGKFDLTVRGIYKVIERVSRREINQRQVDMFPKE